jgi:hypothetical protein
MKLIYKKKPKLISFGLYAIWIYQNVYNNPALFNSASGLGSCPLNRL